MQRGQLIGACALMVTATVASSAGGPARARSSQTDSASIETRVDRLFARWQTADSPGCSVGVSRGGTTVLERGYGRASVELGVPITPASVFHVASVTKPFTAMSILLLARDGARTLRIGGERPRPAVLERVASYTPSAAELAGVAGDYRSDELATTYALRVRDGTLVADVPGRASITLQPIRPDTFAGSLVGAISCARDRDGRVTGFTVHAYAARGLRFERVRRAQDP